MYIVVLIADKTYVIVSEEDLGFGTDRETCLKIANIINGRGGPDLSESVFGGYYTLSASQVAVIN